MVDILSARAAQRRTTGAPVEGLLRWCHPARGMIPPNQFIPLAEATGLISPLTLWVARTAIRQLKLWQEAGIDLSIAINLSADARQRQIVRSTIGMAHELGLTVLAEGIETSESLAEMRALGCDEGQGYLISPPIPEVEFRNWLCANVKTPGQAAGGSQEAERS